MDLQIKHGRLPYSLANSRAYALDKRLEYNKTLAKANSNPTFKQLHLDWCREANEGKFTSLEKAIKDDYAKKTAEWDERRRKFDGLTK